MINGKRLLGEPKGIMEEYKDYNIKLWTFDVPVYNEADFSADGGEDLLDYDIQGGGGTDFECCWEYMKEHNITSRNLLCLQMDIPFGSWVMQIIVRLFSIIHGLHDKKKKHKGPIWCNCPLRGGGLKLKSGFTAPRIILI